MKTVRLITCNDDFQANVIKGALQNEGIESVLHNENFSNLYRGMGTNFSGVDIFVAEAPPACFLCRGAFRPVGRGTGHRTLGVPL